MTKRVKRLDHGWEVEWCPSITTHPDGSIDPDSAEYHIRDFRDKGAAEKFARSKVDVDVFGSVAITEFQMESLCDEYPEHLTREYITGPFYIERQ